MREILFRAKRHADYGDPTKWHYGVPFEDYQGDWIMKDESSERVIQKDTIGQFTGRTDKNDVKIFEGDIVKSENRIGESIAVVKYGAFKPMFFYECAEKVGYLIKNNVYGYYLESENGEEMMFSDCMKYSEVIGNIHDNPELIGGT